MIAALKLMTRHYGRRFSNDVRDAENESHFIRNSGHYPLCGRGDVNTYAVFAELARQIVHRTGRCGIIVPSGIATDYTTKLYFQAVMQNRQLASLYSFWETRRFFAGTDSRNPFCLFTISGYTQPPTTKPTSYSIYETSESCQCGSAILHLSADDIALLNPNTQTCPIFRTQRDAELTKAIYQKSTSINKGWSSTREFVGSTVSKNVRHF